MADLDITLQSAALLVMDCQEGIVGSLAPAEKAKVLRNVGRAIAAARKAGVPVIYVVVQFREGHPEVSARNSLFSNIKRTGGLHEGSEPARVCAELAPQPGEVTVTKRRISAFTGSDLAVVLRAKNVDTLVLTGVSSLGVVESTAREAFDLDYRLVVLGDCCSDRDPEANEIALKWLLPRVARVAPVADFEALAG